jgi:uncharacterized protein (TIGR03437 family)
VRKRFESGRPRYGRLLLAILLLPGLARTEDRPVIKAVVSSADFQPGAAFEGLATIFGTGFSSQEYHAASLPLPTKLGDIQVRYCVPLSAVWDDCIPMELLYVGPNQINFRISYGSRDESQPVFNGALVVRRNNTLSDETRRQVFDPFAPRIFVMGFDCNFDPSYHDASPCGLTPQRASAQQVVRGALTDVAGVLITSNNPAQTGRAYTLWLTGLGHLAEGQPADVQVRIGGLSSGGIPANLAASAQLLYAGASPQFPGLYQINFELPPQLAQNLASAGLAGPSSQNSCGDYHLELAVSVSEGAAVASNTVEMPLVASNGDGPCSR